MIRRAFTRLPLAIGFVLTIFLTGCLIRQEDDPSKPEEKTSGTKQSNPPTTPIQVVPRTNTEKPSPRPEMQALEPRPKMPTGKWIKRFDFKDYGEIKIILENREEDFSANLFVDVGGAYVEIRLTGEYSITRQSVVHGVITSGEIVSIQLPPIPEIAALNDFTELWKLADPMLNDLMLDLPFSYHWRKVDGKYIISDMKVLFYGLPTGMMAAMGEAAIPVIAGINATRIFEGSYKEYTGELNINEQPKSDPKKLIELIQQLSGNSIGGMTLPSPQYLQHPPQYMQPIAPGVSPQTTPVMPGTQQIPAYQPQILPAQSLQPIPIQPVPTPSTAGPEVPLQLPGTAMPAPQQGPTSPQVLPAGQTPTIPPQQIPVPQLHVPFQPSPFPSGITKEVPPPMQAIPAMPVPQQGPIQQHPIPPVHQPQSTIPAMPAPQQGPIQPQDLPVQPAQTVPSGPQPTTNPLSGPRTKLKENVLNDSNPKDMADQSADLRQARKEWARFWEFHQPSTKMNERLNKFTGSNSPIAPNMSDQQLAEAIKKKLNESGVIQSGKVEIEVKNGVASLSGAANNLQHHQEILKVVATLRNSGVSRIESNINYTESAQISISSKLAVPATIPAAK
ncbi:MAG: BON domain-containing protein [Zavarzinella sp.]